MSDDGVLMTEEPARADRVPKKPVYDQEYFLDLARPKPGEAHEQVRERWNAWRRDPVNADVAVTFQGVDFRRKENRGIWFDGFEFGDDAQFDGANFGVMALFNDATFEWHATFRNATFGAGAHFGHASFGDRANFRGTKFADWTTFAGATFGHEVDFGDATFVTAADFKGATLGFGTKFIGVTFGGKVDFSGQTVEGVIAARELSWNHLTNEELALEMGGFKERLKILRSDPSKLLEISFAAARFFGDASFADRSFEYVADFTGVRFDRPPDFAAATNLHRINLTGAHAGFVPADHSWWKPHWTTDSTIAIRLRALRSQIEATKNHDFERDLYIEERKAERGIYFDRYLKERRWGALAGHCLWIGVMAVYWAFSDYGRSWLRPAIWLAASIPTFDFLYAHLLADRRETAVAAAREAVTKTGEGKDALVVVKGWQAAEARVLADYDATVGQLAVSNAVPFVGPLTIDGDAKKFLYCGVWPAGKSETVAGTVVEPCRPIPPPGFQAAMISQNLLSLLLVFFIGLALRNYFRVK